jgi:NAD(P)-dependent dehydrogenase (short-subunit alcohol dehydrogenase family)
MTARCTVVVGGAKGIGEAVSRRLAREAWAGPLVIADIAFEAAEGLAEELRAAGCESRAHAVDISDPASIRTLAEAIPDAERLAIVAGIHIATPSLEADWDDFDRLLRVNVLGNYFVAQAFARGMVERGSGAIVALSSVSGRLARVNQAAYCASKAAIRQALRCLALETVPHGVRVNTVSPGATETAMLRGVAGALGRSTSHLSDGSLELFRPRVPDGRMSDPDEVASAVAYLLSPESAHIALQDLVVDGGESMGM